MKEKLKEKLKKWVSAAMAAVMMFGIIATAIPPKKAVAAPGDIITVKCVAFPRNIDPNHSVGWWNHDRNLYLMNDWSITASDRMVLMTTNGEWSGPTGYCVEPGVPINSNTDRTEKDENYWDYFPSNESIQGPKIQIFLGRILQYGWTGNHNTGWVSTNSTDRDNMANAMATQFLIWETVVGERDENFNHVAPPSWFDPVMSIVAPTNPIRNEIWEHYYRIEQAVKDHVKKPDFGAPPYEMEYKDGKYIATLTDRNGVLEKYEMSTTASGVSISQRGNTLTVTSTDPNVTDFRIRANRRSCTPT